MNYCFNALFLVVLWVSLYYAGSEIEVAEGGWSYMSDVCCVTSVLSVQSIECCGQNSAL